MPIPRAERRPTAVSPDDAAVSEFEGLVNVAEYEEIGWKGLRKADNVEIDDNKHIRRRDGFSSFLAGAIGGAYATLDQSKAFVIDGTVLKRVMEDGTTRTLQSGLSGLGIYCWAEDPSNYVYYTNGIDNGIIRQGALWIPLAITTPQVGAAIVLDNAPHQMLPFHLGDSYGRNTIRLFATYLLADGRESAPSAVWQLDVAPEVRLLSVTVPHLYAGTNLYCTAPGGSSYYLAATVGVSSFTVQIRDIVSASGVEYPYSIALEGFDPDCAQLAFYQGKMYASLFIPSMGMSVIWISQALRYHLFNRAEDFITVVGETVLLLPTEKGLVIGTDNQIYSYNPDTSPKLVELADYGVVPGSCGAVDDKGVAYFWTLRGIAKGLPYELVTESKFSGDPGVVNHARLFYRNGYLKLVASTIAGNPVFNARIER